MHYVSLVALRRSCVSISLCKQFTSGNVLKQSYKRLTGISDGGISHFYTTAASQTATVNQAQTEAEHKKPSEKVEYNSVDNLAGLNVLLGGTKPDAQETLNNMNTSKAAGDPNKDLNQLRKHIKRFFAKYPKFTYDPTKPYTEEFIRMTQEFGWRKGSEEYKAARKKLNTASVLQFNENFDREGKSKSKKEDGSNPKKKRKMLRKWIRLFDRIDIKDPVMPKTVPEFEERVKSVHTNICDVLHTDITGGKSTDWENEVILSQYTLSTDKIFPRNHPLAGTLLRHLFRHILSPSETRGFEKETETQKK